MTIKYVHWSMDTGQISKQSIEAGTFKSGQFTVDDCMTKFFDDESFDWNQAKDYYQWEQKLGAMVVEDNDGVDRWVFTTIA